MSDSFDKTGSDLTDATDAGASGAKTSEVGASEVDALTSPDPVSENLQFGSAKSAAIFAAVFSLSSRSLLAA